jgi:hypothetical protein
MKKAQGLSMNVIIIAALAILVLVILAVLFINQAGIFSSTANACEGSGGVCERGNPTDGCSSGIYNPALSCDTERYICCMKLGG